MSTVSSDSIVPRGSSLPREFYLRNNVIDIAKELLGKLLITRFNGELTGGLITETEAYAGVNDRASHAFGGRRTPRNEPMYAKGGTTYVYLCYGIHHLFNVVTHQENEPHAVLIRGIHPIIGKEVIAHRRAPARPTTHGPGTLTTALGIRTQHSGLDLLNGPINIEDIGIILKKQDIVVGPRIGVDYAGADAVLPYRFHVAPSRLRLEPER
jgi:DNA-3-methyladenine glycosylase